VDYISLSQNNNDFTLNEDDFSNEKIDHYSKDVRNMRNKDKPLIRRKSDLPQDSGIARALTSYKRADEFLKTPPDGNKC